MSETDVRLRGPHLIGQANLNTSVSSQSGTAPALGFVVIPTNAYTFFQALLLEIPGTIGRIVPMIGFPPLIPDADAPVRLFANLDPAAKLYASEWRHVEP